MKYLIYTPTFHSLHHSQARIPYASSSPLLAAGTFRQLKNAFHLLSARHASDSVSPQHACDVSF